MKGLKKYLWFIGWLLCLTILIKFAHRIEAILFSPEWSNIVDEKGIDVGALFYTEEDHSYKAFKDIEERLKSE